MSKPKLLKVTDGFRKVTIAVSSLRECKEKAKEVLYLHLTVQVTLMVHKEIKPCSESREIKEGDLDLHQKKYFIEREEDFIKVCPGEIIMVIPIQEDPIQFSVQNMLSIIRIRPENVILFSDADMVTLATMDSNQSGFDLDFVEETKEQSIRHISEDQELRDALGFVYLHHQKQDSPSNSPSSPTPTLDSFLSVFQTLLFAGNELCYKTP